MLRVRNDIKRRALETIDIAKQIITQATCTTTIVQSVTVRVLRYSSPPSEVYAVYYQKTETVCRKSPPMYVVLGVYRDDNQGPGISSPTSINHASSVPATKAIYHQIPKRHGIVPAFCKTNSWIFPYLSN